MAAIRLLLVGLAAFVLAGCGGKSEKERIAEIDRQVQEDLAKVGPIGPGLGEASPPPPVTFGWKTDFSRHSVPLSEFQAGGPGKDGIPALDRPRFAPVPATRYLKPKEPVIELELGGQARAYPLQIMVWHEIVNDRIAGVPVAVTFCPLCNTAIVFDRRVGGRTLSFGTTGNLRNSDLVMYDRESESWWQQFGGRALVGAYTGRALRVLPARIVSFQAFRRAHPRGLVLTRETGYERRYGQSPYPGYDEVGSPPWFPAARRGDRRLQAKERVVFVERAGRAAAVPFSVLARRGVVRVSVAGERLVVRVLGSAASALDRPVIAASRLLPAVDVRDERGRPVPFSEPFWFAVAAFRPDTRIVRE